MDRPAEVAARRPLGRPSRRAVLATGAWATPVLAAGLAAPAAAASPCLPAAYLLNWGVTPYTRTSDSRSGTATITAPAAPTAPAVTLSITSVFSGSMVPISGTGLGNLIVYTSTIGGTSQQGLMFYQSFNPSSTTNGDRANRQTTTFTFSQPVSNLSFIVTDIDSQSNNFWDDVEITSASSLTATRDATVSGGTTGPWYQTSNNNSLNPDVAGGNISVRFTVPVTTFTLVYWNKQTSVTSGNGTQGIFVGDMSFTYAANTC